MSFHKSLCSKSFIISLQSVFIPMVKTLLLKGHSMFKSCNVCTLLSGTYANEVSVLFIHLGGTRSIMIFFNVYP